MSWTTTRPHNGHHEVYGPDAVGRIDLKVGPGKKVGDVVAVGAFVGVCNTDSDGGAATGISTSLKPEWATVTLGGVWLLEVTAATAVTQGAKVYLAADGTLTTAASTNKLVGLLHTSAMANGVTKHVQVYLLGYTG